MTVKCANGGSNGKLFTKHQCLNQEIRCELDQVVIHMTFFVATENENEYYINTHADTPQRAMYHMDEDHPHAGLVFQENIDHEPAWKIGETWIIDKIKCGEKRCPVFVRAGLMPQKGTKI